MKEIKKHYDVDPPRNQCCRENRNISKVARWQYSSENINEWAANPRKGLKTIENLKKEVNDEYEISYISRKFAKFSTHENCKE